MIYISHPYTGNEAHNISEAESIAVDLAKRHPKTLFINPLAVMKHEGIAKRSYHVIIDNCLELLGYCQAVIFTGDWRYSKGCMAEYGYAKAKGMIIYESVEQFNKNCSCFNY